MTTREENLKKIRADELEQVAGGSIPQTEDKNYKAHEDAIKKIPPTTIIPIPMIPITQPISPPKTGGSIPQTEDKNYKAHEDAIKKIPPITIIPIPMIPITQPISPPKI